MRSANNPILVGLVLLFLLGHFVLLVGILMRIGATTLGHRRPISRSAIPKRSGGSL